MKCPRDIFVLIAFLLTFLATIIRFKKSSKVFGSSINNYKKIISTNYVSIKLSEDYIKKCNNLKKNVLFLKPQKIQETLIS